MEESFREITPDPELFTLSLTELIQEIIRVRDIIRYHRDQKGDDRCWIDDIMLYETLPERTGLISNLPKKEVMMENCTRFKKRRSTDSTKSNAAPTPHKNFDSGLEGADKENLVYEVLKLRDGIRKHRDKGNSKTFKDDMALYALLPDGMEADFSLPEGFLEGCERFWETRQRQSPQKLHEW